MRLRRAKEPGNGYWDAQGSRTAASHPITRKPRALRHPTASKNQDAAGALVTGTPAYARFKARLNEPRSFMIFSCNSVMA